MDRKKLLRTVVAIKKEAKLDFALGEAHCCQTCTWAEIESKHGKDCKGIFLKWFRTGMNASKWNSHKEFYIGHNITKAQAEIVIRILKENGFNPEWSGDEAECIKISED